VLPTVAEVLALDPVRSGAPRVLAGADRLDAPVRWVHVIELAQAAHLLRGGELVLSTGIALPDDTAGLQRYVAELAAVGVSALAVELGSRYSRTLPSALVSAAAEHRLPLIVLERETQFIEITEAVHARIIDAQLAELRSAQRVHAVFTALSVDGAPALGYRAPRGGESDAHHGDDVLVVTGEYAAPILRSMFDDEGFADVRILAVENRFFGGNIKVAGLLTGQDLIDALVDVAPDTVILLPDVCLSEGRFLDGLDLNDLGRSVMIVPTTGQDLRTALTSVRSTAVPA